VIQVELATAQPLTRCRCAVPILLPSLTRSITRHPASREQIFYAGGKLATALPYRTLRTQALELAQRLATLGLQRGARLAIVAETTPDFLRFFFACQYAGLVPVALPSTGQPRRPRRVRATSFAVCCRRAVAAVAVAVKRHFSDF